jgi:hypothetical protein
MAGCFYGPNALSGCKCHRDIGNKNQSRRARRISQNLVALTTTFRNRSAFKPDPIKCASVF